MGSQTVDEAAEATTGDEPADIITSDTQDTQDDVRVDITKSDVTENAQGHEHDPEHDTDFEYDETVDGHFEDDAEQRAARAEENSAVLQGAGAVVSAVLGFVSLSGSWIGTIANARQSLVGQLETSSDASVSKQIQVVYGDAWQATAFWGGIFSLAALVVGVLVLARPAFGNPSRPQALWVKSVSWAGVALGVIGLLLAVLKYTDALLGLPSAT